MGMGANVLLDEAIPAQQMDHIISQMYNVESGTLCSSHILYCENGAMPSHKKEQALYGVTELMCSDHNNGSWHNVPLITITIRTRGNT